MEGSSTIIKQLSIKVKACQRLSNEAAYYKVEARENETKLAKMRSDGRDPYDIKKFEEVLDESYMMIPDSEDRFQRNVLDLQSFVTKHATVLQQSSSEWIETANQFLRDHNSNNSKNDTASKLVQDVVVTNVDDLMEGEAF
jgi:tubulin-specific chaperone A